MPFNVTSDTIYHFPHPVCQLSCKLKPFKQITHHRLPSPELQVSNNNRNTEIVIIIVTMKAHTIRAIDQMATKQGKGAPLDDITKLEQRILGTLSSIASWIVLIWGRHSLSRLRLQRKEQTEQTI